MASILQDPIKSISELLIFRDVCQVRLINVLGGGL